MQINICVNNCIEVIDASDNSQLKLTTIGHRTGPYSLSELLRLACTLNPRRQFVPILCDSCLIIKNKLHNCIKFCFLSFFPCIQRYFRALMRRAQGQNTVPHEGFEPRSSLLLYFNYKKAPRPTAKSAPAILRSMHMRGKFYQK